MLLANFVNVGFKRLNEPNDEEECAKARELIGSRNEERRISNVA